MKLIGSLLAASVLLIPAEASSAPAGESSQTSASAAIVYPLSLIKTGDLLFGNIASGPTSGTVTVDANTGARTVTGGVTLLGGSVSPASFTGAGSGLNLVIIQLPGTPVTLTRAGGTETVKVTSLSVEGGQIRLLLSRRPFTFNVGGTLAVGPNQREGTYRGTFLITVNYL